MKKYIISAVLLLLLCSSAWSQRWGIEGYFFRIGGGYASRGCVELRYKSGGTWKVWGRTCVSPNGYFIFNDLDQRYMYYLYGYGADCGSEYGTNGPIPLLGSPHILRRDIHAESYTAKPGWCLNGCCLETFSPPEENDNE